MHGRSLSVEQVLTLLAAAPVRIATISADLPEAHLQARPGEDGWSANEVLAHLRACADVWGSCIATMLAVDTPTLRATNPGTWMERTEYAQLDFATSLASFATQRTDLLAILTPLPPEGWSRAAVLTGAGKALRRTVLFYAQWLASHERSHFRQFERIRAAIVTWSDKR